MGGMQTSNSDIISTLLWSAIRRLANLKRGLLGKFINPAIIPNYKLLQIKSVIFAVL